MKLNAILVLFIFSLSACEHAPGEKSANNNSVNENDYFKTWNHYLGDPERTHFSVLDQITTENVGQLKLTWSYNSGGLEEGRNSQIQTNPLIIGEKLLGVIRLIHYLQ